MAWFVEFHRDFDPEYDQLDAPVRERLLAQVKLLEQFGPSLGRPHADTLHGSKHVNMKELRFRTSDGVWRFAFAFDPGRRGIILCGGDKAGESERRFYRLLIAKADLRFDAYVARLN